MSPLFVTKWLNESLISRDLLWYIIIVTDFLWILIKIRFNYVLYGGSGVGCIDDPLSFVLSPIPLFLDGGREKSRDFRKSQITGRQWNKKIQKLYNQKLKYRISPKIIAWGQNQPISDQFSVKSILKKFYLRRLNWNFCHKLAWILIGNSTSVF